MAETPPATPPSPTSPPPPNVAPQQPDYGIPVDAGHSVDAELPAEASMPAISADPVATNQGYAPGAQASPEAYTQPAVAKPMSRKTKRNLLIVLIAVVVLAGLIVAFFVTRSVLASSTFGPDKKVEEYLQAVVDGEASTAVELADPNVTNDRRGLLNDEVYAAVENRPTEYRIGEVGEQDDAGNVTVEAFLTQDGREYPITVELTAEGNQAVLFDDWRITSAPWSYVYMSQGPSTLEVNGVETELSPATEGTEISEGPSPEDSDYFSDEPQDGDVDVPSLDEPGMMPALPGTYTFQAPEGSTYVFYGDDISITVTAETSDPTAAEIVHFEQQYTDQLIEDVVADVESRLASCVTNENVIVVPECEAVSYESTIYEATRIVSRNWSEGPTIRLNSDNDSGYSLGDDQVPAEELTGDLFVTVDAELEIEYEYRDEGDEDWEESSTTLNLFTPLSVTDEALSVVVDGDSLSVDYSSLREMNPSNVKSDTYSNYDSPAEPSNGEDGPDET
ncbi:hypothetical protein QDX25_07405 [Auritidibacter ignavus]|uniref:hypothetical protein n=1 Tax=Auritidibacter ignavus TaxID=678932 RepID=UPI002449F7B4|nr:hypothetical protein [Auritidibacter ignavus]WGH82854.1 hypothetical protein QDX25_07405 [Auritidibacter ignavus]